MKHLSLIYDAVQESSIDSITEYLRTINGMPTENNPNLTSIDLYQENVDKKYTITYQNILTDICAIVEEKYAQKINEYCSGIVKYSFGQNIGMHRDWEPEDTYVITNKKKQVHLGSILYLNDDYKGGNLILYRDKDSEMYFNYKPIKNSLIIFDSSIYHSTQPISENEKYCITCFYSLES